MPTPHELTQMTNLGRHQFGKNFLQWLVLAVLSTVLMDSFAQVQPGESCQDAIEISVTEVHTNIDLSDPLAGIISNDCAEFQEDFNGGCSSSFIGSYGIIYEYSLGDEFLDALLGNCISFVGATLGNEPFGMFLMDGCPSDPGTSCIAQRTFDGTLDYGILGPLELPTPHTYYLVVSVPDNNCGGGNCPGFKVQVVRSPQNTGEFGCTPVDVGSTCNNADYLSFNGGTQTSTFDIRNSRDDFHNGSTCNGRTGGEDYVLNYKNATNDLCVDLEVEFLSDNPQPIQLYISQGCPGGVGSYCVEKVSLVGTTGDSQMIEGVNLQKGQDYYFIVEELNGNSEENRVRFTISDNNTCKPGRGCDDFVPITIGTTYADETIGNDPIDDHQWNRYYSGFGQSVPFLGGDNVFYEFTPATDDCVEIRLFDLFDNGGLFYESEVGLFDGCVSSGSSLNLLSSGKSFERNCQEVVIRGNVRAGKTYSIVVALNGGDATNPVSHYSGRYSISLESISAEDPEMYCSLCSEPFLDDCITCINGNLEGYSTDGWRFYSQDNPNSVLVQDFPTLALGVNDFDNNYALCGETQKIPETNFPAALDGEYSLRVGGYDYPLLQDEDCPVLDRCQLAQRDILIDSINTRIVVDFSFAIEGDKDGDGEEEAFGQVYMTDGVGGIIPCKALHYSTGYPAPAGFTNGAFTNTNPTSNVVAPNQIEYALFDYIGQTLTLNMKVCDSEFKENQALGFLEFSCSELPYVENIDTACLGEIVTLFAPVDPGISAYVWDDGSTNFRRDVDTTGTYSVTITYMGCDYTIDYDIFFEEKPVFDITFDPLCIETPIQITNNTVFPPEVTVGLYEWNLDESLDPAIESNDAEPTFTRSAPGNYSINLHFVSGFGCVTDSIFEFEIIEPAEVLLADIGPYCPLDGSFRLSDSLNPIPAGGYFEKNGVTVIFFNPANETPNDQVDLTYFGTDPTTGCPVSKDFTIGILDTTPIFFSQVPDFVCNNGEPYELDFGNPAGGIYSGDGVFESGGTYFIDPQQVLFYPTDIYYELNSPLGCPNIKAASVDVEFAPNVNFFTKPDDICHNGDSILLDMGRPDDNPPDQYYYGTGVRTLEDVFDPVLAGPGVHDVIYHYEDPITGCFAEDTVQIEVFDTAQFVVDSAAINVCRDVAPFLPEFATPLGGDYLGPAVNASGQFDPALVPGGDNQTSVLYIYDDPVTNCTSVLEIDVLIYDPEVVSMPSIGPVCQSEGVVALSGASPAGGTFSGPGVSNNNFDPDLVGSGTFQITYTYVSAYGCESTGTMDIQVIPGPGGLSFSSVPPICSSDPPYELTEGSPPGGQYSGTGVNSGFFDPSQAVNNPQEVFYTFTDPGNGCVGTVSQFIEVFNESLIFAGNDTIVCLDSGPFNPGGGNEFPTGGSFSGPFVSSGLFDPQASGEGTFTVTYSYNSTDGCSGSDEVDIVVRTPSSIAHAPLVDMCENAGVFDLVGGSPSGGIYRGFGVVNDDQFDPMLAGAGSFNLDYEIVDGAGCITSVPVVQTIASIPAAILDPNQIDFVCKELNPFDLVSFGAHSPAGGYFIGDGVSNDLLYFETFDTDTTIEIGYVVENGTTGCSDTATASLEIRVAEEVVFLSQDSTCFNGPIFNLRTNYTTGTFTGPGVVNGTQFDPSLANPGVDNTLTFSGTDNGCSVTQDLNVFVYSDQNVTQAPIDPICLHSGAVRLDGATPVGGTYFGPGVSNGQLYPDQAGVGTHTITYRYDDPNGCLWVINFTVDVVEGNVSLNFPNTVCKNAAPFALTGGSPSGGDYFIDDVIVNTLDPTAYALGFHEVKYVGPGTSGSCVGEAALQFEIVEEPQIAWSNLGVICENQDNVLLDQALPTGGAYYINGTLSNVIDPEALGAGTHVARYDITDVNGCTASSQINFDIQASPSTSPAVLDPFCADQVDVALDQGTPAGGVYRGPGMDVTTQLFQPKQLSPGTYLLDYIVSNVDGCTDTAITQVQIKPQPTIYLDPLPNFCESDGAIVLDQGNGPVSGSSSETYFVEGNQQTSFNPANYGPGVYAISYVFEDGNCQDTALGNIEVFADPAVTIATFQNTICSDAVPFTFQGSQPDDVNGVYEVDGTQATEFDPSQWPVGDHTIGFIYTSAEGCTGTDDRVIEVLSSPAKQSIAQPDVCVNGGNLILTQGNPIGVFSGPGVLADELTFDPVAAGGVGTYDLTFTETDPNGCVQTSISSITVVDEATVTLAQIPEICVNNGKLDLNPFANPAGGTFYYQNQEITGGQFDPAVFGPGNFDILYHFESNGNCEGGAAGRVVVNTVPQAALSQVPSLCENDGFYSLVEGSPAGGVYLLEDQPVNGVDPSQLAPGNYTLKYIVNNASNCADTAQGTVLIEASPAVAVNDQPNICAQGGVFDLVLGAPTNGVFSGPGVISGNKFDPSAVGIGTYQLTYSITDGNGCTSGAISNIKVIDGDALQLDSPIAVCEDQGVVDLYDFVEPQGGEFVFNGDTLENGELIVAGFAPGSYQMEYRFMSGNGCFVSDFTTLEVNQTPNPTLSSLPLLCTNGDPLVLSQGAPAGGNYYLDSTIVTQIDPAALDSGEYLLEYELTSPEGCVARVGRNIELFFYPDLVFPDPLDECVNNDPFNWGGAQPVGGEYKGPGTVANQFTPSSAGVGIHEIWYVYSNAEGCIDSTSAEIEVLDNAAVTLEPLADICESSDPVALAGGNPTGGFFSGVGVVNGVFDPSSVGPGLYTIRYTWNNGGNCGGFAENTLRVFPTEELVVFEVPETCQNGDPIVLDAVSPAGGYYEGANIVNGMFDPAGLAPGNYAVEYFIISPDGCRDSVMVDVAVLELPVVNHIGLIESCQETDSLVLFGGSPVGGYYSGPHVQDSSYMNPEDLGEGDWVFNYIYKNAQGCADSTGAILRVFEKPLVVFDQIETVCIQGDSIELVGGTPTGGVYTGPGVANGYFYPELAGEGMHTLSYTFTDANSCTDSALTQFEVYTEGAVGIDPMPHICVNEDPRILTEGYPAGGSYSGTGVVSGSFDPALAGIGEHTIFYDHATNQGCASKVSTTILVRNIPTVNQAAFVATCTESDSIILQGGTPAGGIYSGPSVMNDSVFYPNQLSEGDYEIVYLYQDAFGCENSDSSTISVFRNPVPNLDPINSLCLEANPVELLSGSPIGGYYTGPGVINGYLYPQVAGEGVHTYSYTVSENGCEGIASANFEVIAQPNVLFNGPEFVCEGEGQIPLFGGSPQGGVYSGDQVQNGEFNYSGLNPGNYRVVYTFEGIGGCVDSAEHFVRVKANPVVTFSQPNPVCEGTLAFDLYGGFPSGGTYSGIGVFNNQFDPIQTGSGTFEIYYSYSDNDGCTGTDTTFITVNPTPEVYFNGVGEYCVNQGPVELDLASPAGGNYSGPGVTNGYFYPSNTGVGIFEITYSYTDNNGCNAQLGTRVEVHDKPSIVFNLPDEICENADSLFLDHATPTGGTYSGPGVTQGIFYPGSVNLGAHSIEYFYKDTNQCEDRVYEEIVVRPQPNVLTPDELEFCINEGNVVLSQGAPSGGTWSGFGVVGGEFNPELAGAGSVNIYYSLTNLYGCVGTDTTVAIVHEAPVVSFDVTVEVCNNTGPFDLLGGQPAGGNYFGSYVSNNQFLVNPAPLGVYDIGYWMEDPITGCRDTAMSTLEVLPIPVLPDVVSNSPVCLGETIDVSITPTSGQTYQWIGPNGFNTSGSGFEISDATPDYNGQYALVGSDGSCFSDTTWVPIAVIVPPANVNYSFNSPVCESDTLFLQVDSLPGVEAYWNFGGNVVHGQELEVHPLENTWNGSVSLYLDGGICYSESFPLNVVILDNPGIPEIEFQDPACFGDPFYITTTNGTGHEVVWNSPAGVITADSLFFNPFEVGDVGSYSARFIGQNGCVTNGPSEALVGHEPPRVSLPNDTVFCPKEGIFQIKVSSEFPSIEWFRNGLPQEDYVNSHVIDITAGAMYRVDIHDYNGCFGSDEFVAVEDCPASLYIPNSFSPNGDGLNEFFSPKLEKELDYTLTIYDRWGEVMYKGNQDDLGWNGNKVDGTNAKPDVYIWMVIYDSNGNGAGSQDERISGMVTLVK